MMLPTPISTYLSIMINPPSFGMKVYFYNDKTAFAGDEGELLCF